MKHSHAERQAAADALIATLLDAAKLARDHGLRFLLVADTNPAPASHRGATIISTESRDMTIMLLLERLLALVEGDTVDVEAEAAKAGIAVPPELVAFMDAIRTKLTSAGEEPDIRPIARKRP